VGIVSYWFNRGQATIARHLRSALDELGHESRVLARPTKPAFVRSAYIASDDVWEQPGVARGGSGRSAGLRGRRSTRCEQRRLRHA